MIPSAKASGFTPSAQRSAKMAKVSLLSLVFKMEDISSKTMDQEKQKKDAHVMIEKEGV